MTCICKQYEARFLGTLEVGNMYMHKNTMYTVLRKSFDSITVFNHTKHNTDMIYTPCNIEVSRIIRGELTQ